MPSGQSIAVVGAGTTVGKEIIHVLEERAFPVKELIAVEKKGYAGDLVQFRGQGLIPRHMEEKAFRGAGITFFAAGQKASMEYAKLAAKAGSTVIDLSPAFRMDEDVPLVIPEINPGSVYGHEGIIACPSASTIQLLLVLHPIHAHAVVKRAVVSAFEAVSDAGEAGMDELSSQIKDLFRFREAEISVFPQQTAFNVVPQTGAFLPGGYTVDELNITAGTNRIVGNGKIRVCATAAQVPVFFSHSQSVVIETEKKITPEEVRGLLEKALSVTVEDGTSAGIYPLAINATGKDECLVGRIRQDLSSDSGIVLWTAMDNIRKGAALNAVQIAELLVSS